MDKTSSFWTVLDNSFGHLDSFGQAVDNPLSTVLTSTKDLPSFGHLTALVPHQYPRNAAVISSLGHLHPLDGR